MEQSFTDGNYHIHIRTFWALKPEDIIIVLTAWSHVPEVLLLYQLLHLSFLLAVK